MFNNWWVRSIQAGAFIALGCILYLLAPNPIVGAALFSIGLISVRLTKSYLFTGQVQKIVSGKRKIWQLLLIWIGNALGVLFVVSFIVIFGNMTEVIDKAKDIGMLKAQLNYMELFARAICCGALMTIATRKDTPLWITSGCVMAFVLAGFNHCIADIFYYLLLSKFYPWDILIITLGNFIGGILPVVGRKRH